MYNIYKANTCTYHRLPHPLRRFRLNFHRWKTCLGPESLLQIKNRSFGLTMTLLQSHLRTEHPLFRDPSGNATVHTLPRNDKGL